VSRQRRYDKVSVTVDDKDELRRLARERGCSVSEYVRRAVTLERVTRERLGAAGFALGDDGGLDPVPPTARPHGEQPPEQPGGASPPPRLMQAGPAEVTVAWASPDGWELTVAVNDTELLVGPRDKLALVAWNLSAAVQRSRTTPRVVISSDAAATDHQPDDHGAPVHP
jgi:hypothetical protein